MDHRSKWFFGIRVASVSFIRIMTAALAVTLLSLVAACASPAAGGDDDVSTLPPVSGMSPVDGGSVNTTSPTLSWKAVSGAKLYELQIAESLKGVTKADIIEVYTNSYTPNKPLTDNKTYYWHVRGKTQTSLTKWSDIYSIVINSSTGGTNTGGTNTGGTNTGGTNTGGTNTGGTNTGGTGQSGNSKINTSVENGSLIIQLNDGKTYTFKYSWSINGTAIVPVSILSLSNGSIYSIPLYDDDMLDYIDYMNGDRTDYDGYGYGILTFTHLTGSGGNSFTLLVMLTHNDYTSSYVTYEHIDTENCITNVKFPSGSGDYMSMNFTPPAPIYPTQSTGELENVRLLSFTLNDVMF